MPVVVHDDGVLKHLAISGYGARIECRADDARGG